MQLALKLRRLNRRAAQNSNWWRWCTHLCLSGSHKYRFHAFSNYLEYFGELFGACSKDKTKLQSETSGLSKIIRPQTPFCIQILETRNVSFKYYLLMPALSVFHRLRLRRLWLCPLTITIHSKFCFFLVFTWFLVSAPSRRTCPNRFRV